MATIYGTNAGEVIGGTTVQDHMYGYGGNDILYGYAGNDYMYGQGGNDLLYGHAGNDYLDGGDGNDTLIGGEGADGLTGGKGADVFKYNTVQETWYDAIWDFKYSEGDKIDLSGIDAKTHETFSPSTWGNQAFHWVGNLAGKGLGKGDLGYQYVGGDTYVYGNTDSDAAYEVALRVSGHVPFIANDFFL
ncbi:M10 family metallopeptidase C-terminal domain-containing protein [Roseicella aerolata]|uniref:M10 family metallopeptidase C-terminal domain-containing protein n=1 Tax=Roseicella aerolata TaxID=2883479 RepID=A0A9X1I8P8_9PROT|nr:M10 family metallopeptidase C-terminal domain-containing protein [Roseicella aerolata]MCB4820311.1 M10 family metallopeptidase C-terminal domain-containing protein [Roseicella aerolata]